MQVNLTEKQIDEIERGLISAYNNWDASNDDEQLNFMEIKELLLLLGRPL